MKALTGSVATPAPTVKKGSVQVKDVKFGQDHWGDRYLVLTSAAELQCWKGLGGAENPESKLKWCLDLKTVLAITEMEEAVVGSQSVFHIQTSKASVFIRVLEKAERKQWMDQIAACRASISPPPLSDDPAPGPVTSPAAQYPRRNEVRVLHDLAAYSPIELSIKRGEILLVLKRSTTSAWWQCRNSQGQEGAVPRNYITVERIEDEW